MDHPVTLASWTTLLPWLHGLPKLPWLDSEEREREGGVGSRHYPTARI